MDNNLKEMHREIIDFIHDTYLRKNKDYGSSFDESLDEFGLISSLIRLTDKRNRFKSLINSEAEVKDESIEDTLLDMANYAIMTVMWLRQNQQAEEDGNAEADENVILTKRDSEDNPMDILSRDIFLDLPSRVNRGDVDRNNTLKLKES